MKDTQNKHMFLSITRIFAFSFGSGCSEKTRPSISHGIKDTGFLNIRCFLDNLWCFFYKYSRVLEIAHVVSFMFCSRLALLRSR